MTSTNAAAATAELSKPGGILDLGHDRARLLIRTMRLLALGGPVARDEVLSGISELGIDRTWAAQLDAWAERDEDGRISGLGITYKPTPHQMTINGNGMWAWCGMDTLIFAHILDITVDVEAHAPVASDVVRLRARPTGVTDIDPADAVVTERVPIPIRSTSTPGPGSGAPCAITTILPRPRGWPDATTSPYCPLRTDSWWLVTSPGRCCAPNRRRTDDRRA